MPGGMTAAPSFRSSALTMVAAAFFFAAMSAAVKAAAGTLPNTVVVFFRNAVALVVLVPWMWHRRIGFGTGEPMQHFVRGFSGLLAMSAFFYAIAHLRLADAVILNYTLPLWLPLFERIWLGEPLDSRLALPLGVGFAGILLILKPGTELFAPAALWALVSALLAAVGNVGVRALTRTEPAERIVFYFALIGTLGSALPLPWTWVTPVGSAWLALVAAGLFATAGQFALTRAYSSAPAAQVGPFLYSSVVFSASFDWLLWRGTPDRWSAAGAALVVASAILTLQRQKRKARE
jgi:drug/metabolite transporter (DMT)-like permease